MTIVCSNLHWTTSPICHQRVICRLGVTHTLDEVFHAPLVIKKVINDESHITKSFVGSE